jgi:hypothetical protein
MQWPTQCLGDFSPCIRQRYATGIVALQPASFGRERHSPVGAIEPPDGSPLHRIAIGRLLKQPYQRKSHCLGLVRHCDPKLWLKGKQSVWRSMAQASDG